MPALVVSLIGLGGLVAGSSATAAGTCPTGALAFSSQLTNGTMQIGRMASSSGNSATACGSIGTDANGSLQATVSAANVTFAKASTTVLILKLPTTVKAVGDLKGPASIGADGYHVTLSGPVEATANLLGSQCTIALSPALTTEKSGRLTGTPLKDDGTGTLRGKLVANEFAVAPIKSSRTCPSFIALLTNTLLGMPLAAGQSTVQFDVALKLGA